MTPITSHNTATTFQLPATQPLRDLAATGTMRFQAKSTAEEVREQFTQFVGEAFFGQMIKAMRSMTGKPAYFHGGRAEEVFQGQLDQKLAEHLTESSASRFAEPMFERQFPRLAAQLESQPLDQLRQLPRR
jgi:hypothetical protein